MPGRTLLKTLALLLCMISMGAVTSAAAQGKDKDKDKEKTAEGRDANGKPQTKKTQALGKESYATLEAAQALYDAKNYKGALAKIDELQAKADKLNDYEKAMGWNFRASIQVAQEDLKSAMESYKNVYRQKDIPDLLRNNALFAIAQLSFSAGNYEQAIKVMNTWMKTATDVKPEQHLLIAQSRFQLKQYGLAEEATIEGLKVANAKSIPLKESWLSLLRASFYELKNYAKAASVLESMVKRWPKLSYWQQLAGMYGLQEKPADQLAVLRATYESGAVVKEPEQLNLARLYLVQETPYPAVQVLKRGFAKKQITETPVTLQLYAQALSLAREHEDEILVLGKLAAVSGESKHYLYLGQAHIQLGQWADAADAYRKAAMAKNVTRPGNLQMMLGNALYNDKRYAEAKAAFQNALQYPETVKDGATWVNFMDKEIQRLKSLSTNS